MLYLPSGIPGDRPWAWVVFTNLRSTTVVLLDDMMPIGYIKWLAGLAVERQGEDAGLIAMIYVDPGHRRQGAARQLLDIARDVSEFHGWTPPTHSDVRTPEGVAFTTALGVPPPPTEDEMKAKLNAQASGSTDPNNW